MSNHDELFAMIANAPDLAWLERAACGDLDLDQLDMFFVDAGRTMSKEAAALCERCPARRDCLDHAYRFEIAGGYYGGISPSKRRALSHAEAIELIER